MRRNYYIRLGGLIILEEEWRDIIIEKSGVVYNFTGLYQVSNLGRVKNTKTGQVLKLHGGKLGYINVGLSIDGCKYWFKVHRLVATAFIPNPDGLPVVNHIDENKQNNSVDNLEWCTQKRNIEHSLNKKVRCIETGQVFDNARQVLELLGIRVYACCAGKQKTAGGYSWEYVD